MPSIRPYLKPAKQMRKKGHSVEEVILELRQRGASMGESRVVIARVFDLGLSDAKAAVINSNAWSDQRGQIEALHDAAETVLRELSGDNTKLN